MKGSIFNLFESFVTTQFGEDTYDDILAATELETQGPFVGPGVYPAGDLLALVHTTTSLLGITTEAALQSFGRFAFPVLARSVPTLMEGLDTPRDFLMNLESVIHTEIRKLDPAASPPRFAVLSSSSNEMVLRYQSPFGLFSLVAGFLDGLSDWFDSPVDHELLETTGTNGTFRITFGADADGADSSMTTTPVSAHG